MKVKCIRNDNGFNRFLTIGKIYEIVEIFPPDSAYVLLHDKGKGMAPINYFDVIKEEKQ